MSNIIFPYDTLHDQITVELETPRFDGHPSSNGTYNPDERIINLFAGGERWKRVDLLISASVPKDKLEEFEAKNGPSDLIFVVHCRPTNTRQLFRPKRSKTDRAAWQGVLELDRDNFRDRAELRTLLTATVAGMPHRPVALGETWTLHFDEPASLKLHGNLNVRWMDFKTQKDGSLEKQYEHSTHVVSFDKELPEIHLNSGFDGLEALLKDRKDRDPDEKGIHDMLRMGIARSVWMTLVNDALAAIRLSGEGEEPDWPSQPWQTEILKRLLHEIDPTKSEKELLRLAGDEWNRHPGSQVFQSRTEAIIGDWIRANAALRSFVQQKSRGGGQA